MIDWEEWRPLWDRNWGTKRVYQTLSVAHALQTNRSLTMQQATEKAKQQFQVRTDCEDRVCSYGQIINEILMNSFFSL